MPDLVALTKCQGSPDCPYPGFPYEPDQSYPELPAVRTGKANPVYKAVRQCFYLLGLDRQNYNTPSWNPFGEFVQPGQQVLIKPNWVMHRHASGDNLFSVITHPSVIRPVIDYALLALKGKGRIIIADAPLQSADFDLLMRHTQMPQLVEQITAGDVPLEIRDLRQNICRYNEKGQIIAHEPRAGDDDGYVVTNLGSQSFLSDIGQYARNFRVTNYDPHVMPRHHSEDRHEYLIAGTVLDSDVVINVPKLKTHRKAGLTCCLKNVVGINGSKDYLPHHRLGSTAENGDEYLHPSLCKRLHSRLIDYIEARPGGTLNGFARFVAHSCRSLANRLAHDPYYEGSWFGNDTIWRTILDLNYALRYARLDGTFAQTPQRKFFNIVDAFVVGAGEGPLNPTAVFSGIILAGFVGENIDAFAARLIGLDPQKIPILKNAVFSLHGDNNNQHPCRLACADMNMDNLALEDIKPLIHALPPDHWQGHVELDID